MNRKRLYLLVWIAGMAGISWIAANLLIPRLASADTHFCLFRMITGIPCPACGSTRSILSLLHGDLAGLLYWNPLGMVLLAAMIIFPLWVLADWVRDKSSFLRFYRRFEKTVSTKWFLFPALTLIILNWTWNIVKGL